MTQPGRLRYYRDLIVVLLSKDFKVRYKNTVMGYAWSLLNPLLFAAVFVVVFNVFMRIETKYPYALFLVAGLFPWQWFTNSVNASNGFFLANGTLIKKVQFPRSFLVYTGVLSDGIHFVISLPVIAAFVLWYHWNPPAGYAAPALPSIHWLWQIPALVLVQLLITEGLALIVATTNLFFRDLERLTGLFTLIWFYLTPVIYPAQLLVDKNALWVLYANPMASLVICWQQVFLEGTLPADHLGVAALFGAVVFVVGYGLYRSREWRFAEIV